jgi:hypothetical protein
VGDTTQTNHTRRPIKTKTGFMASEKVGNGVEEFKGFGCKTAEDVKIQILFNMMRKILMRLDESEETLIFIESQQKAFKQTF